MSLSSIKKHEVLDRPPIEFATKPVNRTDDIQGAKSFYKHLKANPESNLKYYPEIKGSRSKPLYTANNILSYSL